LFEGEHGEHVFLVDSFHESKHLDTKQIKVMLYIRFTSKIFLEGIFFERSSVKDQKVKKK